MVVKLADFMIAAFEERGYRRVAAPKQKGGSVPLWYLSSKSTAEVCQYVVLEPKWRRQVCAVSAGFSHPDVRALLRPAVPLIRSLAASPLLSAESLCWMTFDAGWLLDWHMQIPEIDDETAGPRQFAQLCQLFLAPLCENVTSRALILERLLADDPPFRWSYLNPIARAAEIAATAILAGSDLNALKDFLLENRRPHSNSYRGDWDQAIPQLFAGIAAAATNR